MRDHLIHFNLNDYYADNMRKLETTKRWTQPQKRIHTNTQTQISFRIYRCCNHILNVCAYTTLTSSQIKLTNSPSDSVAMHCWNQFNLNALWVKLCKHYVQTTPLFGLFNVQNTHTCIRNTGLSRHLLHFHATSCKHGIQYKVHKIQRPNVNLPFCMQNDQERHGSQKLIINSQLYRIEYSCFQFVKSLGGSYS